jgi:hypothetical protein
MFQLLVSDCSLLKPTSKDKLAVEYSTLLFLGKKLGIVSVYANFIDRIRAGRPTVMQITEVDNA